MLKGKWKFRDWDYWRKTRDHFCWENIRWSESCFKWHPVRIYNYLGERLSKWNNFSWTNWRENSKLKKDQIWLCKWGAIGEQ